MESARLKKETLLAGAVLVSFLVVLLPFVLLAGFWWSSAVHVGALGALVAVMAYTSSSRSIAIKIVIIFAVVGSLGVAVSSMTLASVLLIALCAGLSAYSSRWGLAAASQLVAVLVPYLIHSPPSALPGGNVGPGYYLAIALTIGVAGLWAVAVLAFALRHRSASPVPLQFVPAPDAALGAVLIALVSGCVAFVALTWFPDVMWVWLLLTILLLTKPTKGLNLLQTRDRALGTVAGAVVAGLLSISGLPAPVLGLVALLLIVAALTSMLMGRPYWLYATLLTPAVVLMDASSSNGVDLAAQRVAFTIGGALVAVALAFLINVLVHWRRRRYGTTAASAPSSG